MDSIGQYFLSVIAASVVSSIAIMLAGKKGAYGSVVKLLSGIFLSITIIRPLGIIRLSNMESYFTDFETNAEIVASDAEANARMEMGTIISANTRAYILDKASKMGLQLEVEVMLSDDMPPRPDSVILNGNASPYAKKNLQKLIADNLGIPEERQIWK